MTAVRSSFVSSVGRSPPDHPSFAPIAGLLFPRSSIDRARPMAAMAGAFSLWKWSPCSRWRPPHASYASDKLDFLKKTVSSHDIVIFSKTYCPYCSRAKSVFKELKKEPFVLELDEREDGPDIQDALSDLVGRRTVPQVFVHGEHLGGSDDTVDAYKSGRLLTLLGIGSKGEI